MASTRFDEARDYGFADKALALRERAGLTQRELAALLGVSGRAIQTWEAGLSYPGGERLTWLIALYVERGAFPAGREEDEAMALWEAVRSHAPRRIVPFDRFWFASLRATAVPAGVPVVSPQSSHRGAPRWDDWGETTGTPAGTAVARKDANQNRSKGTMRRGAWERTASHRAMASSSSRPAGNAPRST